VHRDGPLDRDEQAALVHVDRLDVGALDLAGAQRPCDLLVLGEVLAIDDRRPARLAQLVLAAAEQRAEGVVEADEGSVEADQRGGEARLARRRLRNGRGRTGGLLRFRRRWLR